MRHIIIKLALATGISGGLFVLAGQGPAATGPKIVTDPSPPERSGPLGGFADVVDRIAPSVVGVFTTREPAAQGVNLPGGERFFESPMFREFFGQPHGGKGAAPRAPRPAPKQTGLGSGVILSADGYILTNNHVVDGADGIRVRLHDGEEHGATIVATDPASDVAVIKVDEQDLPAAVIGSSAALKPGDVVLAIGSPFGLSQTVTSGIVSAVGRNNLNITGYEDFIQTDASINPGNSGGALVDNQARVVGINTAIFSRSGGNVGIGFAIPIDMAVNIGRQLIQHGEITRGYLGVALAPLSDDMAEALNVADDRGVVVNDVMPDTPASEAGLEPGDVITACDGEPIANPGELRLKVAGATPGTEIDLEVQRGDEELVLEVTIGELPDDLLSGNATTDGRDSGEATGALKGVRLRALDEATRQRMDLDAGIDGVLVVEVAPDSAAAAAGLQPGEIITAINRKDIGSPREAYKAAAKRGERATLLRVTDGRRYRFLAIGN